MELPWILVFGSLLAIHRSWIFDPALVSLPCLADPQPLPRRLAHEAYVWQRAWTDPVREAVIQHGSNFSALVVLSAEVNLTRNPPELVQVRPDYEALAKARCPVGLALRIGPYPGPFSTNDPTVTCLTRVVSELIAQAQEHGLNPSELQVDFDCADSKLEGYRLWLEAIRGKLAPLQIVFTALPSWLKQASFGPLAHAADSFVLQVHSVERPRGPDAPYSLCDPVAARHAVDLAGTFGIPFRVALPTYGYLLAFDAEGRLLGLSAEGPRKNWPAAAELKEIRADPKEMLQLVQQWTASCPPAMRGIIWYRLPTSDDILNWQWPTLHAIVSSHSPRMSLRGELRRVETGLVEINLVNDGELDISSRLAIEARWPRAGGTHLVAGDGLRGFEMVAANPSTVRFQINSRNFRLPAGQQMVVGWLRFDEDREVQLEIVQ